MLESLILGSLPDMSIIVSEFQPNDIHTATFNSLFDSGTKQ